jgi:hypothetical protein
MAGLAEYNQHNSKQIEVASQKLHELLRRALKGNFTGSIGVRVVVKRNAMLGTVRAIIEEDVVEDDDT